MEPITLFSNMAYLFGATIILFLPFELFRRYQAGELTRKNWLEMAASISPVIGVLALNGLTVAFIGGLFSIVSNWIPWDINTSWATAIICLVLVDLLYFLDHYCGHRFRFYWALSHSVHHSSPLFDQTTALRISAIDGFTSPWFLLPAVLAGFDPLLVLATFGVVIAYQQWIHTETIGKLKTFDSIFNSPSNHRVHHGSDPIYLDRNYGGILIIWDKLFDTYQEEQQKPTYGLVEPIGSVNPIDVHLHEAVKLWRDIRRASAYQEVLHHIFARPGAPYSSAKAKAQ
jgi:sterol desaturase/sphingolipid hydroxylase (fatty acid hydroxylase superfamily)